MSCKERHVQLQIFRFKGVHGEEIESYDVLNRSEHVQVFCSIPFLDYEQQYTVC